MSIALAIRGAYQARDHLRAVDVVILFFSGIGTGASLTVLAIQLRQGRLDRSGQSRP